MSGNIRIIAKSANREKPIKEALDNIASPWGYEYWYGSGLWYITIYTTDPDEYDLTNVLGKLQMSCLDICMVFHGEEIVDDSFFKHVDETTIKMQPLEAPTGKIFKLNMVE